MFLVQQAVWSSRDSEVLLKNLQVRLEPMPGVGLGLYLPQPLLSCCCQFATSTAVLERELHLQLPDAELLTCESVLKGGGKTLDRQKLFLTELLQRGELDASRLFAPSECLATLPCQETAALDSGPFPNLSEEASAAKNAPLQNGPSVSSRRTPAAKCRCSAQSCFRVLCFRGDAVLSPYNCADSEAKSTLSREELDALISPQEGGPNGGFLVQRQSFQRQPVDSLKAARSHVIFVRDAELEPMCHLSPAFTLTKEGVPFSFHLQAHPYMRSDVDERVKAIYANHYCAAHCKAFFDQTDKDVPCLVVRWCLRNDGPLHRDVVLAVPSRSSLGRCEK